MSQSWVDFYASRQSLLLMSFFFSAFFVGKEGEGQWEAEAGPGGTLKKEKERIKGGGQDALYISRNLSEVSY